MTCKDCLSHLVCAIYGQNLNDILANGESCSEYKNKADYVKVVRCEKCVNRIGISVTGEGYCSIHDVSVPLDYYCGSGRGAEPTTENKVKETLIRIVSGPHKVKKRKRRWLK